MKPAHHHVVTGFDADGAPTPVMAKITCQKDGERSEEHTSELQSH